MSPDKKQFLSDRPLLEAALLLQHIVLHSDSADIDRAARYIGHDALEVLYYSALRQRKQLHSPHHHEGQSSNVNFCPQEAGEHGLSPAKVRKQLATCTERL